MTLAVELKAAEALGWALGFSFCIFQYQRFRSIFYVQEY